MQQKFRTKKLDLGVTNSIFFYACCLHSICIIISWQLISPDPVQVLPFVYSDMPYLCMAVCFSLFMCVISAQ